MFISKPNSQSNLSVTTILRYVYYTSMLKKVFISIQILVQYQMEAHYSTAVKF